MEGTPVWLEKSRTCLTAWPRPVRLALCVSTCAIGFLLMALVVTVPLDFEQQCAFAFICLAATLLIRVATGRLPILAMIALSLIASLRYLYWRLTSTLGFDGWLDCFFGYGLVATELYAMLIMLLGYLQTAWPLGRQPALLQTDPGEWPTVDVFIPTYNEPLDIVKLTVLAARAIDWPKDKLRVYVLDDGRREEFRTFCQQAGVGYITRDNNHHAKAGNLNEALKVTDGQYIAFFDADHIPTRAFLQVCMGWFLKNPKLALLQTPHFFFSPDPFEKNLRTFRSVPNEGELFYGLIQDGNDLWNASFFCGSCAVIRRPPLLEIGGIAVETVTEDAHTALKLNRCGYDTAYLAIPQAAGLATESLSRHINQRIRWARGMTQIFRTDNPLLGKGLNLGQRLCYLNAMLHFFYSLPRLVFLTAPLAYLMFDAHIFHASASMISAFVFPHIILSTLTNSRIQGRFRHSFWNEIYETVLAWHILRPVLMALINPKAGGFNVTDKGGVIEKTFFDWQQARPCIVLLVLNLVGLIFGVVGLMTQSSTPSTLLVNLAWTLYNLVIISAALGVASETRQVRSKPRVDAALPVQIHRADGTRIASVTRDFSESGLGFTLPAGTTLAPGEQIQIALARKTKSSLFPATVMFSQGSTVGAQFNELDLRQQSELVRLTFSRADIWVSTWGHSREDKPLVALGSVCLAGLKGIVGLLSAVTKETTSFLKVSRKQSKSLESSASAA
ncbi:cellulose synthase (UDP-forming) [Pseudomonas sp. GGS8]|uniref:UDP-forming cellulose synthase catalytic subunit n=1 Tax=Pseudomonas sp. GGS8 TaxID=2817892 RepID=UPI002646343F|nr:UDP-forming cellulose synthase catalytic subunit [Pseudomonas sp. GGS8]MCP1446028.1 cellulose synthase (UDP-forming) [Pseudomonas sp. GGS8]